VSSGQHPLRFERSKWRLRIANGSFSTFRDECRVGVTLHITKKNAPLLVLENENFDVLYCASRQAASRTLTRVGFNCCAQTLLVPGHSGAAFVDQLLSSLLRRVGDFLSISVVSLLCAQSAISSLGNAITQLLKHVGSDEFEEEAARHKNATKVYAFLLQWALSDVIKGALDAAAAAKLTKKVKGKQSAAGKTGKRTAAAAAAAAANDDDNGDGDDRVDNEFDEEAAVPAPTVNTDAKVFASDADGERLLSALINLLEVSARACVSCQCNRFLGAGRPATHLARVVGGGVSQSVRQRRLPTARVRPGAAQQAAATLCQPAAVRAGEEVRARPQRDAGRRAPAAAQRHARRRAR
jgi:hypothetical protein